MTKQYKFKARCLVCEHSEMIHHESKADYQEVNVCPRCNGAFVDIYKIHKHINNQSNEIEIVMGNANEPPTIKLNGKDIKGIISIDYKYETSDCHANGHHNFTVEYCDNEANTIRTVSVNRLWEG